MAENQTIDPAKTGPQAKDGKDLDVGGGKKPEGGGPKKQRAIIVGQGFALNGRRIIVYKITDRVRARSKAVIEGSLLNVYDKVQLGVGQNWYNPVDFKRAHKDNDPISFLVPNFNQVLKDGDPVFVRLISSSNPAANGYIIKYLVYSAKTEEEEEKEKAEKKAEKEGRGKEGGAGTGGPAGIAVAAMGEALGGIAGAFLGGKKEEKKFEPRKVSSGGSSEADTSVPDEDYDSGASAEAEEAVEATEGPVSGTAEISAGAQIIGQETIGAARTIGQGSTIGMQGAGAVSEGGTREVFGQQAVGVSGTAGGGQRVGVRGSVSGEQKVEVSRTSQAGGAGSVTTGGQAEVSVGGQAQQGVSASRTVSGAAGGGGVKGKTSVTSEAGTRQKTEESVKATVQGGGGSAAVSGTSEASVQAKSGGVIQGGGAKAEEISGGPAPSGQPAQGAGKQNVAGKSVSGGGGSVSAKGVAQSHTPPATGGTGAGGFMESNASGTAQFGSLPISQGTTAGLGVQFQSGAPGAGIGAATLKTSPKGNEEKPEAEVKPAEQAPVLPEEKIGLGLKTEKSAGAAKEEKPEKPAAEEAEALAKISPGAKEAALSFIAKEAAQMKKVPGVSGQGHETGRGVPHPGAGQALLPQAGREAGLLGGEKEASKSGKEEAGGTQPQSEKKQHGDLAIPESLSPAAAPEEQQEGQSAAPVGKPLSGGEGEVPQEEKENGLEEGEPQNEQAEGEGQQQDDFGRAVSDRMDKLAEDRKLDAEIKQVTKEAGLVLDQVLMQGVVWVWGAAIPSFSLSVFLGALIGDFLWAFKNSIITGVLKPLLKTEALKKKGEEIAKQIKISSKVKLNILAMNLVAAAIIMLVFLFVFLFIWVGCNYPPGITRLTYKLSVIGELGGIGMCESLDNMASNFSFGGGDSGGGGASDSWACQPVSSGPASAQNLSNTCFGANASKASAIAGAESGGIATRESGVDKCTADGSVVSFGLFQINISAQNNFAGLNCRSAFNKMYTAQTRDCRVVNKPLYDQCVAAAKDAQKNIEKACQISGNGNTWSAWGANKKCGF